MGGLCVVEPVDHGDAVAISWRPIMKKAGIDIYFVQDKGTIIIECGKMLSDAGYKIKVLNTINFKKSMRYNPFHYIRSEKDILKLVNTIIANTKGARPDRA